MKLLSTTGLLGAAVLLSIAASCVLAAPNHKPTQTLPSLVSSPPMPTVQEPEVSDSSGTDVTDFPAPTTTASSRTSASPMTWAP